MGNVSFLSPTKNNEFFNIEFIYGFLVANFKEYSFDMYKEHKQIQIRHNNMLVADMFFNQQCYLLSDIEHDILDLKSLGLQKDADKLEEFKNSSYDRFNMVEFTHGIGLHDERREIEIYLHNYFGLYIFDDGIHPEFISPEYVYRERKKRRKKRNFLNKLINGF